MYFLIERIKTILKELSGYMYPKRIHITTCKVNGDSFEDIINIPEEFNGETVFYEVRTGRDIGWDPSKPEFLVYINGRLVQGMDANHKEVLISSRARAGDMYNILLHAYSGMHRLMEVSTYVAVLDRKTERLYYNMKNPLEVAELLDEDDKRRIDILKYLDDAVNILDLRKPFSQNYNISIKEANEYLEREFYAKYLNNEGVTALCTGYTHIDLAWLWTLNKTKKKAAGSFSTVINLMKQYPEFIFMSTQPQLYRFVEEEYPEVYEEIKEMVRKGRWEPEGCMWVEADCNLPSGESIVRQILFGKRFFKDEFGVENRILWLPDTFGFNAALPQIMKKSGIDYFMTTKISWNEYNKFPYDTFMWRGIDGTEVLSYFITTRDYEKFSEKSFITTYNGKINPSQVMGAWQRYRQKNINDEVLISFGYGDGGGGPDRQMLENARRLSIGISGCPKIKTGKAIDFFKVLENKVLHNKNLPVWAGELYLENHRGTYTSMANNKRYNRKSELLYMDVELFSAINKIAAGGEYDSRKINEGWETILRNQFHDIICGTSIKGVYEDSHKEYIRVLKAGKKLLDEAISSITSKINVKDISAVVFNGLGFDRSDIAEFDLPEGWTDAEIYDNGKYVPSQITNEGKVLFFAQHVPCKGYKTFTLKRAQRAVTACRKNELYITGKEIKNKFFDIKFDIALNIISIFDRINKREVIKNGERANVIQAFEDKPYDFDAWNIEIYYQQKMWEINEVLSVNILEEGPVRAALKVKRKFLDSTLIQIIYIYRDIPRIDFLNRIDWREKQILLKAAFPVDIHAESATYEIQFGNIERPAHWNTSWDYSKFEVYGHKWADLSEDCYGVSLLNDCKYGYDIKDGLMRLTLLKSPIYPNPDADKGVHEFTYSLYPHTGDWRMAGTVNMAYSLNCPMYVKLERTHEGKLPGEISFIKIDKENVVLETVKKAEDSNSIIIRIYECHNKCTKVHLTFFEKLSGAYECDLMENNLCPILVINNSFEFEIKPYEIKTFKLNIISK